jgi:hypothetical protein
MAQFGAYLRRSPSFDTMSAVTTKESGYGTRSSSSRSIWLDRNRRRDGDWLRRRTPIAYGTAADIVHAAQSGLTRHRRDAITAARRRIGATDRNYVLF